jgi:hypothetical protein
MARVPYQGGWLCTQSLHILTQRRSDRRASLDYLLKNKSPLINIDRLAYLDKQTTCPLYNFIWNFRIPSVTREKRHGSQDDSLCLLQEFFPRLELQDDESEGPKLVE